MHLVSRRTPDYVLPPTDASWVVRGNPTHRGMIDRLDAPRIIRCLIVDDTPAILTANHRVLTHVAGRISNASKEALQPSSQPFVSFEIYVPQNNRADLDILDDSKISLAVGLLTEAGVKASPDLVRERLISLKTKERPFGATDGLEALLICMSTSIDLVATDLDMPGANGLNFFMSSRHLNRADIQTRVPQFVVISGDFNAASPEQLISAGAPAVVYKPFTPSDLTKAVNYALFGVLSAATHDCFELVE